jgi:hypothetical protein
VFAGGEGPVLGACRHVHELGLHLCAGEEGDVRYT